MRFFLQQLCLWAPLAAAALDRGKYWCLDELEGFLSPWQIVKKGLWDFVRGMDGVQVSMPRTSLSHLALKLEKLVEYDSNPVWIHDCPAGLLAVKIFLLETITSAAPLPVECPVSPVLCHLRFDLERTQGGDTFSNWSWSGRENYDWSTTFFPNVVAA
eukprot:TRINITY_DN42860_c0_g1_i2.p1 TRINITY_DN42860_c0_g1~~TRINITY_DN42860_c0_g1_i2.p1  ORF type:complete len:158 (-),score=12.26 TRINITY_DN42860_c0_g1_i2:52-525(-)